MLTDADVAALRSEFPAFARRLNDAPLVYLDSASTTQKPAAVIAAATRAYEGAANIHRGVHALSVENTEAYEAVRTKAAALLGAADPREVVFVRGTTEAINLIAQSYGRANVGPGDEIIVTELEHHSNLVPWQMLCREKGATLRVLPIDERGDVVLQRLDDLLGPRTKIVAAAHVSNSLGTVLPVAEIARRARAAGAISVIDGAQAIAHRAVDVAAIGCDFYAFYAHKLYGPTGAGVLWGRRELLEAMPPWQGGGDMILAVSFAETTYNDVPHRFEAGTPDIVGVIALGAAIDWIRSIGLARIASREAELLDRMTDLLADVPDLRFVGTPRERASVVSFNLGDLHPHDVGTALDLEGMAVRTGHHCTQPVMEHFGVAATVRASLGVFTTSDDLERLASALKKARHVLGAT
jgi:cysteine desulfurase/selenocysteine lyase